MPRNPKVEQKRCGRDAGENNRWGYFAVKKNFFLVYHCRQKKRKKCYLLGDYYMILFFLQIHHVSAHGYLMKASKNNAE